MKLIVGLGNPDKKYGKTRHNIGWRVVEAMARKLYPDTEWKSEAKFESEICRPTDENLLLVKPLSYMNSSGTAVSKVLNYYKIEPAENLLIIHDDKDIVFGKMKLEKNRSDAGQKGVRDIINKLGTKDFSRLRFGVGHETQAIPTEAFILQAFTEDEESELPNLMEKALDAIKSF